MNKGSGPLYFREGSGSPTPLHSANPDGGKAGWRNGTGRGNQAPGVRPPLCRRALTADGSMRRFFRGDAVITSG
jgi:hypothetical protein